MVIPSEIVKGEKYNLDYIKDKLGGSKYHGIMVSAKRDLISLISHGDFRNKHSIKHNDRWDSTHTIYYYHGSGEDRDQDVNDGNCGNRQLRDSLYNDKPLYLFIESSKDMYEFIDQVKLIDEPFYEKDDKGFNKLVFPLVCSDSDIPVRDDIDQRTDRVKNLSDKTVSDRAKKHRMSKIKPVMTYQYERDEYVREFALRRSKGHCDLCSMDAPFKKNDGSPYLEVHHIVPLSQEGTDTTDNVCALCPNCHRKMHVVKDKKDVARLKEIAKRDII